MWACALTVVESVVSMKAITGLILGVETQQSEPAAITGSQVHTHTDTHTSLTPSPLHHSKDAWGRGETDFQFVLHLERDQSQYVME